jgi:hypothetical protein
MTGREWHVQSCTARMLVSKGLLTGQVWAATLCSPTARVTGCGVIDGATALMTSCSTVAKSADNLQLLAAQGVYKRRWRAHSAPILLCHRCYHDITTNGMEHHFRQRCNIAECQGDQRLWRGCHKSHQEAAQRRSCGAVQQWMRRPRLPHVGRMWIHSPGLYMMQCAQRHQLWRQLRKCS